MATFTISATFTSITQEDLSDLFFEVVELSNNNILCNTDGGPAGVGSTLSVPPGDLGGDGKLTEGESFTIDFEIGLENIEPFTFFVDAYGL